MGSYVVKESAIKAEIIWVLKKVMSGFSEDPVIEFLIALKLCFPIVRLLQNFHLPEQKVLTR